MSSSSEAGQKRSLRIQALIHSFLTHTECLPTPEQASGLSQYRIGNGKGETAAREF